MTGNVLLAVGLAAASGLAGMPAHANHHQSTRKAYVVVTSTDQFLTGSAPIILTIHTYGKHPATTSKDILAPWAGKIAIKGDTTVLATDASAAAPYSTLIMRIGWSPSSEVVVSGQYTVSAISLGLSKPWKSTTPTTTTTSTP